MKENPALSPEELVQAGYRYALSLTHHPHDAEDLVQQAWMRLHHRYGGVETKALLFKTVRNLFTDKLRRSAIVVFEPMDDHDPAAEARPPASADLDTLLAQLRSPEREALYLSAVEGYTAAEIGELWGNPRGSVLSLIYRAKAKLRRWCERESKPAKPRPLE
ncbi:MAG: RNA polymerase sigma factor [Verrucomicrobiota bacterium]